MRDNNGPGISTWAFSPLCLREPMRDNNGPFFLSGFPSFERTYEDNNGHEMVLVTLNLLGSGF